MFREMLRKKQALSREECIRILTQEPRGVLAVHGEEGYPYAIPMNHWYDPEAGTLFFHSGKQGHKMNALAANSKVSFCVYDSGRREEGDWALNIRSVVVFGRVRPVEDAARAEKAVRLLCEKYTDDQNYVEKEMAEAFARTAFFEIEIDHMTGKLVREA